MSFLKEENGEYKWANIGGTLIILGIVLLAVLVSIFYEPKQPETTAEKYVPVFTGVNEYPQTTVVNYNYYKIDGKEAPLDLMNCQLLELTAGGYALVCPSN